MPAPAIVCSNCGHTNPAGNQFCGSCGTQLPAICSACGMENSPGNNFCGGCGTRLSEEGSQLGGGLSADRTVERHPPTNPDVHRSAPPAASPQSVAAGAVTQAGATTQSAMAREAAAPSTRKEERRLVTALFCDLVGFTPLSERLDPEEVRDIQAEYFEAMSSQVQRYGGTVEKYAGDAVLALFGAPIAHEDDAERAVLCALGMQDAIEPVATRAKATWKAEPAIRVGVNTGEVVSGGWTASSGQDVAVIGDAVNVASRLQSVADPGEVLVGAETRQLTRRRIRYGDRRDVTLKGKSVAIPVWPAIGVREEFGERWEGYETPLVGRDREMVQLLDAWVRAQGGDGQLVTVVGDAGVGKSRLIAEFLAKVASSGAVRVLRARSLSYGQEISLWLVADLLRSLFGINEQDEPEDVAIKLRVAIPNLLAGGDGSRAEALDVLGEVLGLPPRESAVTHAGPQIRRLALLRSLRNVLGATADRAPTVMVLEDLHWIDVASEDVLVDCLRDVLGLRMLVLAAHRPGWNPPWSEWGWPERMTLRPLREEEATDLAAAVLGGSTLSPDLKHYVADRAGGNPFFLEELLRALRETGGIEAQNGQMILRSGAAEQLPTTLTGVLLARLDRLEAESRNVAQVASVIGRTFALKLLAEVIDLEPQNLEESLGRLQRAEIAFPRRGPDLEYVFKHVSMRDAAYNTLVHKRRQELHVQTARAIASLYPLDEYAEMIAYHYSQANVPEAAEWLERAGDRAASIYASEAAIVDYEAARTRLEEVTELARLDEKLGGVLLLIGRYDEALEALERAAQVYKQQHDLEAGGRVVAQIGMTHRYRGTPEQGIQRVTPMIEELAPIGPSESFAALHLALANLFFVTGRYSEVLTVSEKAAEIARAIGNERLLGEAEERRGTALHLIGGAIEARRVLEKAMPLIERGGDQLALWRALNNVGEAAKVAGDIPAARHYTERAVETAERVGNAEQTAFVLGNLTTVLAIQGEWEEAHIQLERALTLVDSSQSSGLPSPFLSGGTLALWEGDWEQADTFFRDSLALARQMSDRQFVENAEMLRAELNILQGRPEDAVAGLRWMVERELPASGPMLTILAWTLLEAGDDVAAADRAKQAVERSRQLEPLHLVDALRVQGMVLVHRRAYQEARSAIDEGLVLVRPMPFPYAEGRLLVQKHRLLQAEGDAQGARREMEEALAIFRRLGAKRDAQRAEEFLYKST